MMNRNDVYWALRDGDLNNYKVIVNNRPYNKLYIPRDWESSYIKINDGSIFIMEFNEVYLCTKELVIRGKYENFQVNILYKDIDSIEVGGTDGG